MELAEGTERVYYIHPSRRYGTPLLPRYPANSFNNLTTKDNLSQP